MRGEERIMDIETIEEMEGDETMKGITHYKGDKIIDSLKDNKTMKGKERITDHETIDSSKPTQTMTGNEQYQMMIH